MATNMNGQTWHEKVQSRMRQLSYIPKDLATKSGVRQSTISRWFDDDPKERTKYPDLLTIAPVAKALKWDVPLPPRRPYRS